MLNNEITTVVYHDFNDGGEYVKYLVWGNVILINKHLDKKQIAEILKIYNLVSQAVAAGDK